MIDPLKIRTKLVFPKRFQEEERKSIPVSGDLRDIYRNKTSIIPEVTPENIFSVSDSIESRILEDDGQLIDGTQMHLEWLEKKGEIEDSYFIVDAGAAHLPGVALLLATYGIDCSFVIPEEKHSRIKEALKYWGTDYEIAKSSINNPKSFATLIDCHRGYKLGAEDFPSTEKLKGLGIKRIFLLKESTVGRFDLQDEPTINQYKGSDLEIEVCGIDLRQGFGGNTIKMPAWIEKRVTMGYQDL